MHSRNIWRGFFILVFLTTIHSVISDQKDIVFLVDVTSGASSSEFDLVVDFIYDVVSHLTIGSNDVLVSVVTFSSTATESFDFDDFTDRTGLLGALTSLKSMTPSGTNGMVNGLNYVKDNSFATSKGARTLADDTLVLIAYSQSVAIFETAQVGVQLGLNEIHAYTVGIGTSVSQSELMFVSTDPDADNHHDVNSFSVLCDLVPVIVPKLDSTSNVTSADGCQVTTTSTSTTTTTTTPTTTTTTQTTTTTTTATPGPASFKDIIFVVDVSSGANDSDLDYITDFVYKVVSVLTIGDNDTLVSIVTFSDTIEEHFTLDTHKTSASLLSATSSLMALTPSGSPLTYDAFSYISSNAFDKGRLAAPDVVVLVTYSESTSTTQTAFNAQTLRDAGASVFVVGAGTALASNNDELLAVSSSPSSYYLHYVANISDVCYLLPTIVPKLDSSKSATTDVCSTLITAPVTDSSVDTELPVESGDNNVILVVGAVVGGVCITIVLLLVAGILIGYFKKRGLISNKTSIKELSRSDSSIRRRTVELGQTSASKTVEIGQAPASKTFIDTPENHKRHDSDLSSSSHGTASPVALITERDLPGMITKEQEGLPDDRDVASSLVSISDPTNESVKTFDEGYRSNSLENRTPGSAGSDKFSFSSSEKDMFRQDFGDWGPASTCEHSQEHNDLESNPTVEQFVNDETNINTTSTLTENDSDGVQKVEYTTDLNKEKYLQSDSIHTVITSKSISQPAPNSKSRYIPNQKGQTSPSRAQTTPSLADAIHSNTHVSQKTVEPDTSKHRKSKVKKKVLIRQETQTSLYSRRPSMVHIDIGEI